MSWNPSFDDDCAVGLEWFPTRAVDRPVSGFGRQSYSWSVESSAAETIDRLWVFSDQAVSNAYDTIDIYDADDLEPLPVSVKRRLYSLDAQDSGNVLYGQVNRTGAARVEFTSGQFRTENVNVDRMGSGQLNRSFVSLINSEPLNLGAYRGIVPGTPDAVAFTNSIQISDREFIGLTAAPDGFALDNPISNSFLYNSKSSQWSFNVDGLANIPAGHRVLSLTVSAYCQRLIDPIKIGTKGDQPYRIRPALIMGPDASRKAYLGQYSILPDEPGFVSYTWFRNPVTALPWTTTDLANFNQSNRVHAVGWLMSRPAEVEVVQSTAGAIYVADATVRTVPDTRAAVAYRDRPRQWAGWNLWNVQNLSGGNWSKASNKTYLFNASFYEQESVDRRPRVQARGLGVRALGDGTGPTNGVVERRPDFFSELPRSLGEPTDFAPAVILQQTNDDLSADAQPYAVVDDYAGLGNISDQLGPFLVQLVEFDADDLVPDRIRFLARSENDNAPSQPLQITVQGSVGEEATAILTPDALEFPSRWQVFELPLEPSLAGWESGLQEHIIAFTASGNNGWRVRVLTTGEANEIYRRVEDATAAEATFGSDTLYAVGEKAFKARVDADVCVTLGVAPDTPTGLTAEAKWDGCVSSIALGWDTYPISACATPGFLEIQRQNLDGSWSTIFEVADPDETVAVNDYEVRRNATNVYRTRFVNSIGFSSDWSTSVECDVRDDCCGYTFTSNRAPTRGVWYDDLGTRTFLFNETVEYVQFESRDGQTAVRGLTDRLDQFQPTLLVGAKGAKGGTVDTGVAPSEVGRRLFDPLTVLAGNKRDKVTNELLRLPYVCVADSDGNRWFAEVETPSGAVIASGGRYTLNVVVRETTTSPAVARISSDTEPVVTPDVLPPIPEPEVEVS